MSMYPINCAELVSSKNETKNLNTSVMSTQPACKHPINAQDQVCGKLEASNANMFPGAATNTSPVYDANGKLIGLQTTLDNCVPAAEFQQNNLTANMNYFTPMALSTSNNYTPMEYIDPSMQGYYYNDQMNHLSNWQPAFSNHSSIYEMNPTHKLLEPVMEKPSVSMLTAKLSMKRNARFDKCPTMCSLFAILCCPITIWCSLPALVYSLCAYADYRSAEVEKCQQKSDIARHLVITACVVGLLLCVTWGVLIFFYYDPILELANDIIVGIRNKISA